MTTSESPSSVGHVPNGRWEFDESVTKCFDDMLWRSIPDYMHMRSLVYEMGKRAFDGGQRGLVVDVGCSTGGALSPFADAGHECLGLEVSEPMRRAAAERYASRPNVRIVGCDLRSEWPVKPDSARLVQSVLTLQFVPVERRPRILRNVRDSLVDGGMLILVEKVMSDDADAQDVLVDAYHAMKRAHGYSAEDIEAKRLALEGVLVPMTVESNERMMQRAGFSGVECFWRSMNFAAWTARR